METQGNGEDEWGSVNLKAQGAEKCTDGERGVN